MAENSQSPETHLPAIFGDIDALVATDPRSIMPYAQYFLDKRPDIVARLVKNIDAETAGTLLRELRIWAMHGDRTAHLQGLVDVLDRTGNIATCLADMEANSKGISGDPYELLFALAQNGDTERFTKFVEAARSTGEQAYARKIGEAVGRAISNNHQGVIDAANDYLDQQGLLTHPYILRRAIEADNRPLVDQIITLLRTRDQLPELLRYHNSIFASPQAAPPLLAMFRDGVENNRMHWLEMATALAAEVEATPEALVMQGEKQQTVAQTIAYLAKKNTGIVRLHEDPANQPRDLTDLLLAYTPRQFENPSNTGVALSRANPETLEFMRNLAAGDERRKAYFCLLVQEWEQEKGSLGKQEVFLRAFADIAGFFKELEPERRWSDSRRKENLPATVQDPENVPDDFNWEMYRELHSMMKAFDSAGHDSGKASEWARKLTILFENVPQATAFMKTAVQWANENANDQNIWRIQTRGGIFRWPDEDRGWQTINPNVFEVVMDFDLPPKHFNVAGWRPLLLQTPEASRYLSGANNIEAHLAATEGEFPETLEDLRHAVFEEIAGRCELSAEESLRQTLSGTELETPDSLNERLRYGMQFDVAFPAQQALYDFNALAQIGVLGNTVRQKTRLRTARVDEGTKNYGKPWSVRVIHEEDGSRRLFDRRVDWKLEGDPCVLEYQLESTQVIFGTGQMQQVQTLMQTFNDLNVMLAERDREAKFHADTSRLSSEERWALEQRVLINLLRSGVAFDKIFSDNYCRAFNVATGQTETTKIRDDGPEDLQEAVQMILNAKSRDELPEILPAYGAGTVGFTDKETEIRLKGFLHDLSPESIEHCVAFFANVLETPIPKMNAAVEPDHEAIEHDGANNGMNPLTLG